MKKSAALGAVVVVVMMQSLLACGGSSSDSASDTIDSASDTATDSGNSSDAGSKSGGSSDFDCAALKDSVGKLTVPLQLVAQLRTAAAWDLLEQGVMKYNSEDFQSGVEGLRPLESLPVNGADVTKALDVYAKAGTLVAEAQQSPDPASSDANASLTELTSDTQTFLLYQVDIAKALDEAKC